MFIILGIHSNSIENRNQIIVPSCSVGNNPLQERTRGSKREREREGEEQRGNITAALPH